MTQNIEKMFKDWMTRATDHIRGSVPQEVSNLNAGQIIPNPAYLYRITFTQEQEGIRMHTSAHISITKDYGSYIAKSTVCIETGEDQRTTKEKMDNTETGGKQRTIKEKMDRSWTIYPEDEDTELAKWTLSKLFDKATIDALICIERRRTSVDAYEIDCEKGIHSIWEPGDTTSMQETLDWLERNTPKCMKDTGKSYWYAVKDGALALAFYHSTRERPFFFRMYWKEKAADARNDILHKQKAMPLMSMYITHGEESNRFKFACDCKRLSLSNEGKEQLNTPLEIAMIEAIEHIDAQNKILRPEVKPLTINAMVDKYTEKKNMKVNKRKLYRLTVEETMKKKGENFTMYQLSSDKTGLSILMQRNATNRVQLYFLMCEAREDKSCWVFHLRHDPSSAGRLTTAEDIILLQNNSWSWYDALLCRTVSVADAHPQPFEYDHAIDLIIKKCKSEESRGWFHSQANETAARFERFIDYEILQS